MGKKHINYTLGGKMFKFGLLLFSILILISYNIFGDTIRGTSGEKFEGEKIVL